MRDILHAAYIHTLSFFPLSLPPLLSVPSGEIGSIDYGVWYYDCTSSTMAAWLHALLIDDRRMKVVLHLRSTQTAIHVK